MLKHDLLIAVRRLMRQRFYSVVSVVALALGLVCFIATYVLVSHVRSYDRHFENADRTYVIAQSTRSAISGIDMPLGTNSALHLAERLRLDVPELPAVARYLLRFVAVQSDAQSAGRTVALVEAPFFDIFDFDVLAGDVRAATRPRSAVMTRRTAEQTFGRTDVIGRTVTLDGAQRVDVTVVAVIDDPPAASQFSRGALFGTGFDMLVSWDLFELLDWSPFIDSWGNTPVVTYALLPADGTFTVAALNDRLPGIVERHVPPGMQANVTIGFEAQPVSSVGATNLQRRFEGFHGTPWRIDALGALLIFASAILGVACLNFVNLATAQSSGRALDVGARKAVGATSSQLVRQELVQTAIIVLIATALALTIVVPIGKLLTGPWQPAFALPWSEPRLWIFLAVLLAGVTFVAGLYPALVVARVRPIVALRLGVARAGPKWLRTLLVGAQFATASFLVALVVVLLAQRNDLRETLLGRFADPYAVFFLGPQAGPVPDHELLARELTRGPGINGATYMFIQPYQAAGPRAQLRRTADEQGPLLTMDYQAVGYDYFTVLDVRLLAGRVFERERADDITPRTPEAFAARQGRPIPVVLDSAAMRALGWSNPTDAVGSLVYRSGMTPMEVIGVVEAVTTQIRARDSAGTMFAVDPTISNQWIVRLDKDDVAASLAHVRDVVGTLAPGRPPLNITFLDQAFEAAYWTFTIMQRALGALALFAIAIAAIGLFGMASYITERRTREIGVRKTQGASSSDIVLLFGWGFSKPVIVANLIAWPFVVIAADAYLSVFTERTALTPLPFVLALLVTLALAWLAVGARVLRAASLSPATALRHE